MKKLALLLVTSLSVTFLFGQKSDITIEDIWKNYKFYSQSIGGLRSMNDGVNYTTLEKTEGGQSLIKHSYVDAKKQDVLVDAADLMHNDKKIGISDYSFSSDESKLLIATQQESIYRYSSKANYYIYDIASKSVNQLTDGNKQMYATFSPLANKVAFVRDNNLFYKDLTSNEEIQITTDGKKNEIINGASDWVYEEELELVEAFQWSPDGKKIAYFKFNESKVKEWLMKMYGDLYPEEDRFKYPKAGEENSKVEVYIYHLDSKKNVKANIPDAYEYISRINWTNDSKKLALQTMNRHQSVLQIYLSDVVSGESKSIYREENTKYVEVPTTEFLTSKDQFLITSEKDGYNHIYLYDINGKLINQVTKGQWEVTDFYGVDESKGMVYFQSAEISPLQRHIYSVKLNGSSKKQLTTRTGQNNASFSTTFKYFINYNTDANTPHFITLKDNTGKQKRILMDNASLVKRMEAVNITKKEFLKVKVNGEELNAWMIKPKNFDKSKKYPLFMFVYGGPGSQTVEDSWGSFNYFWFQHLASLGYMVVSVDNRGTGARGEAFKKVTYKQLGKYETEDQIAAAKYFSTLPYIDGSRIGIFGWSYGGYMSSLCLTKGADVFKMAIAVAPVTNWRYYDNIYTERYMQTPQENASGYDDNSPINHVEKMKGNYLLIHGMADDNVHFQNATEMTTALIKANKQFTQFSYPNKNHGIYGGNTRLHLYHLMTNFIKENL